MTYWGEVGQDESGINMDAKPFDHSDQRDQKIARLELQVSNLYSKIRMFEQLVTSMLKLQNGKELERIPAATGNVGLPAGDKAQG